MESRLVLGKREKLLLRRERNFLSPTSRRREPWALKKKKKRSSSQVIGGINDVNTIFDACLDLYIKTKNF